MRGFLEGSVGEWREDLFDQIAMDSIFLPHSHALFLVLGIQR